MVLDSGLSSRTSITVLRMEIASETPRHQYIAISANFILASLNRIVYPIFMSKPHYFPVLQIYGIAARNSDIDTQFRLTLADGYDLQRAVLAPVLNDMVQNMMLVIKPGSIVRILKYTLHASVHQKQKRLIKIHDMEVLRADFELIGCPVDKFTSNEPGLDQMKWNEPEDWKEHNWEWLDPEDPNFPWLEDDGRGEDELNLWSSGAA